MKYNEKLIQLLISWVWVFLLKEAIVFNMKYKEKLIQLREWVFVARNDHNVHLREAVPL